MSNPQNAIQLSKASEAVRDYLLAMEARDFAKAASFLAEGFVMTFPGNARFTTPQQLAEWGSSRYRTIEKTYEGFDEVDNGDTRVIYCRGTLGGEWLDGTPFAGIRFIDRFEMKNGLLCDQKVWNDLAEIMQQQ